MAQLGNEALGDGLTMPAQAAQRGLKRPGAPSTNRRGDLLLIGLLAALIGAGSALFFHTLRARGIETDLPAHIRMTALSLKHHAWPPNFLYYWIVALFAGFSSDTARLQNSTIVVLSASCVLRYLVSVWVGRQLLCDDAGWDDRRDLRYGLYVAVAMLQVAHNVIDYTKPYLYLGFFPSNVWHNSTVIFLMPWAILLFYAAWRVLTRCRMSDLLLLAAMGVVNVAIKNSLIQVLAVVMPVAALIRFRLSWNLVKTGLALAPAVAWVGIQFLSIYTPSQFAQSVMARYHEAMGVSGESRVVFEFLALWPNHTVSTLLCSFLYPIAVFALFSWQRLRDGAWLFAVACLVVGLLQYMCLVETGYRRLHGNFIWQVLACTYLLFLCSIVAQIRKMLRENGPHDGDLLAAFPLVLHFFCGLAYIGAFLITRSYY